MNGDIGTVSAHLFFCANPFSMCSGSNRSGSLDRWSRAAKVWAGRTSPPQSGPTCSEFSRGARLRVNYCLPFFLAYSLYRVADRRRAGAERPPRLTV